MSRVLFVYYSYTGQTQKVLDAAADVLRDRGCEVQMAPIEFVDPAYSEPFTRFPMRSVWPDMFSVFKAQGKGETGEIRTPEAVRAGTYDLVGLGSPPWWRRAPRGPTASRTSSRSSSVPGLPG